MQCSWNAVSSSTTSSTNRLLVNPGTSTSATPENRVRTSGAFDGRYVHLIGGRTLRRRLLKDYWRFDTYTGIWTQIKSADIPLVEGHACVWNQGHLYIFGGSYSRHTCPFWVLDNETDSISPVRLSDATREHKIWPQSRRDHSLVAVQHCLYLFGGFIDLHGSTDELWRFDCVSNDWRLLHDPSDAESDPSCSPSARHSHGCVAFNGSVYVLGGQCNLNVLADFWMFNIESNCWRQLRTRAPPGPRFGHNCALVDTRMWVYGGEDGTGRRYNDLWAYDFAHESWHKVQSNVVNPVRHGCLISLDANLIDNHSSSPQLFRRTHEYQCFAAMEQQYGSLASVDDVASEEEDDCGSLFESDDNKVSSTTTHHKRDPSSADSGYSDGSIGYSHRSKSRKNRTESQEWLVSIEDRHPRTSVNSDLFCNPAYEHNEPSTPQLPGTVPSRNLSSTCSTTVTVATPRNGHTVTRGAGGGQSRKVQPPTDELIAPRQFSTESCSSCSTALTRATPRNGVTGAQSRKIQPPTGELIELRQFSIESSSWSRHGSIRNRRRHSVESLVDTQQSGGDKNQTGGGALCPHNDQACLQMLLLGGEPNPCSDNSMSKSPSFTFQSVQMNMACLREKHAGSRF